MSLAADEIVLIELPGGRYEAAFAGDIPEGVDLRPLDADTRGAIGDDVVLVSLNRRMGLYPVVGHDVRVQAHYLRCRRNGESHAFAEMLALRKFPGIKTDSIFNEGRCNGNQFERTPGLGDYYRGIAEEAGVSTTGKHYAGGLASYPGDPAAWISGRGDVLRVAREKGLRVDGYVQHEPGEYPPTPDVEIAPELIDSEVDGLMELDPGARREDVRERVYQLRTGKVDPNEPLVSEVVDDGDA